MISESPTPNSVAERYLKLNKAYVKLANRYASLDVEHGKLRRILIKLLVSYRDLKNELADAQEKIRSVEEQNLELQQFQVLLGDDFLLALEEAEQAETSCEKLLSQEDQSLNHLALEVDEAVKQLEANLPIDVIGTEQPTMAEELSSPANNLISEQTEAETTDAPTAEVTSEVAASTETSETEPEVETDEEPIYQVVQEAAPETIADEVPVPSAAAEAEEESLYEVVSESVVSEPPVSVEEEMSAEEELVYEVAKEPIAAEVSEVKTVQSSEESKPLEAAAVPVSPSDDWDLALGFFDVA